MTKPTPDELATILRSCGQAAPEPLYPRDHAVRTGVPREQLEPALEELRLGGLLRLTDWVAGRGQGYALTPAGVRALKRPEELERVLANGGALPPPEPRPRERRQLDPATLSRRQAIAEAMTASDPPRATFLLILLNVLVFGIGMYLAPRYGVPQDTYLGSGGGDNGEAYSILLGHLGAISFLDMVHGQWWRLLTCCFVHVGFLHLFMNMLSLYFVGPLMERAYGSGRYVVLYLLSGLVGSCFAVLLQPGGQMAGASGALCGLLGSLASWTMINRRYLPQSVWLRWMRAVAINAVLIIYISTWENVSWSAHLGGAVGGLIVGGLLTYQRWGTAPQRALAVVGVVLVPLLCAAAIWAAPQYNDRWKQAREMVEAEDVGPEARADWAKLQQTVVTETTPTAQDAQATIERVYLEVRQASKGVDPALAGRWRKSLEQVRRDCEKAADQFAAVGRLHGRAEVARTTRLAVFRQFVTLSEMLGRCLDTGAPCSAQERDALREQYIKLGNLIDDWIRLKEGFGA